jgi:RNA polymerase sigma-70 factor (sigma-E family)
LRAREAKRNQFEQFVEANGAGLVKLAYNVCGNRESAEDAVQEALTTVYLKWSRLDDPLAYARRVAINATHDSARRTIRQERIAGALKHMPMFTPLAPQQLLAEHDALSIALDELPHRQRSVVVLRYWLQLSEAETADVLNVSTGTVKSQCSRALARMREILEPDGLATDQAPNV